jgi:hypothetical protein
MKIVFKTMVFALSLMFLLSIDFTVQTSQKVTLVKEAQAIIGMPFTPVSAAGVARRTTRRVVATEAAVATTTAATATAAAAASAPKPAAPPPAAAPAVSAVPIGTVVQALPAGCTSVAVGGVNYSDCGGVFYKAAFQGNNLVYVSVEKPMK